jgi:hypothetical protein
MAIWFTWPLARSPGGLLVGSTFAFDEYFFAYVLEWGRHTLARAPLTIFEAPFCYPAALSLASTEHMIGLAPLYAVARALSADPLAALHLTVLFVFALNALAMAALTARWTGDRVAATVAGTLFAFAPLQLMQAGWIHVLAIFCLPLLLLAVDGVLWSDHPWRAAVVLVGVGTWQIALGVYGTIFGLVVAGVGLAGGLLVAASPRSSCRSSPCSHGRTSAAPR